MHDPFCTIQTQRELTAGIFDMTLSVPFAGQVLPGQFVRLYGNDQNHLLPRPISICDVDTEKNTIRLVYRVVGFGTSYFSTLRAGDRIEVYGPNGHGFPVEEFKNARVLLLGGGIGIPPLYACAKNLSQPTAVLGYRDTVFLEDEFAALCQTYHTTENGTSGIQGTVLDAVAKERLSADVIFACGPMPMLKAVKAYAKEQGIPAYLSLEEKMACGTGACLGCVCKTKAVHPHTQTKRARICSEGPVFLAEDLDFD